jgi:hypothetical protein
MDACRWVLSREAAGCGHHRRLLPLILALILDPFTRFAMRICLAAAVAALALVAFGVLSGSSRIWQGSMTGRVAALAARRC